ncbi:MAG: STAS domain-containing protein [Oscillospiraceae bacterium]|jgi:anti-sigma B factor antagonist|nr:STAS domain-containing protein [Oscillospiraceae bacterium]
MKIDKSQEGDTLNVKLTGRLDTNTAPKLEKELESVLVGGSVNNLSFDFKNLEYISSAGLRVLLSAKKKMPEDSPGGVRVKNVSSNIKEVFDVTGFTDILTLE